MSFLQYEFLKQEWIKSHPDATPAQYQKAMMAIARRLGI